jgi:hypothetical protein
MSAQLIWISFLSATLRRNRCQCLLEVPADYLHSDSMEIQRTLLVVYVVILLTSLTFSVFFIFALRSYLLKRKTKKQIQEKPVSEGLSSTSLHNSLQSQVLELQATDTKLPEHQTLFHQLVQFLKESKGTMKTESAMLELYILRLETKPHADLSHTSTLAALLNWSRMRVKELLKTKA